MLTRYFCSVCQEDFGDEIMALISQTCPECRRAFSQPPLRIHIQSREIAESTLPIVVELKRKLEENILTVSESEDKLKRIEERLRQQQQEDDGTLFEDSVFIDMKKFAKLLNDPWETESECSGKSARDKHFEELAERDRKIQFLERKLRAKTMELEKEVEKSIKLMYDINNLSKEQFDLFQSAKILRRNGYTNVFYQDNAVYARKSHDEPPLQIQSLEQIADLCWLHRMAKNNRR